MDLKLKKGTQIPKPGDPFENSGIVVAEATQRLVNTRGKGEAGVNIQCFPSSPDFGTWSRSGPICLSSPEVNKCDFELCTDTLVCMKHIGQWSFNICDNMY